MSSASAGGCCRPCHLHLLPVTDCFDIARREDLETASCGDLMSWRKLAAIYCLQTAVNPPGSAARCFPATVPLCRDPARCCQRQRPLGGRVHVGGGKFRAARAEEDQFRQAPSGQRTAGGRQQKLRACTAVGAVRPCYVDRGRPGRWPGGDAPRCSPDPPRECG